MFKKSTILFLMLMIALVVGLTGCEYAIVDAATETQPAVTETVAPAAPTETPAVTETPAASETPVATETPTSGPVGPENYPSNVNPLTGLPVKGDPSCLGLPPALISVSNFPLNARPQTGLSYSPMVFELFIGEGATRFLAMFYCDFPPEAVTNNNANGSSQEQPGDIGPIRSGRKPYEDVRKLFNGFLVMSSAYQTVAAHLSDYVNVFGDENATTENTARIKISDLEKIAKDNQTRLGSPTLLGNVFDANPPAGGVLGNKLWIPFSYLDQVMWKYNADSGGYNRWQDKADGVNFEAATDKLNGNMLSYNNIIVLFVNYTAEAPTVFDLDLLYMKREPALLFRDGQMYKIYWSTASGDYEKKTGKLRPIRFIDAQGNPFPLKPGQTWVELMPAGAPYYETVDSMDYSQLAAGRKPGSGVWAVAFYTPKKQ